jgi:type II secretory pathway predicted ATPase ExeA
LKNLLLDLDYIGVFVFVDEFESIARLNMKAEQSTLNSIRHLMDQNSHGLCMLFGCAPEVWQDVMSEYHAFSERIGQEVALRPLTDEHIKELVSSYLDIARTNGAEGVNPFEEECIELIHQRSQGNVRQALLLCSRILDAAVDSGQETVTLELVRDVIAE